MSGRRVRPYRLRLEASACAELAKNFEGDPEFRVPRVDWTRTAKRRWKTERGALKAAKTIAYSWVHMPDGKTRIAESSAQVIDFGTAA